MFEQLPNLVQNIIIKQLIEDDFPAAKRLYDAWKGMDYRVN